MEVFIRLRDTVISYLKEKNRSPNTIKNYYSCFNRFERHLKENSIPFSFEAVDQWLDEVTSNLKDIEVNFYRTPMRRLKDVFDGEIKSRHFSPKRRITYPLCQRYKDLLERFLSILDGYSEYTINNRRKYCCGILLCFQENGVYCPEEITYELLLKVLTKLDDGSYYRDAQNKEMMNYLLQFFYNENLVSLGFTLFIGSLRRNGISLWNIEDSGDINQLVEIQKSSGKDFESSLIEFWKIRNYLINLHINHQYSPTQLTMVHRTLDHYYLFLDRNRLCFSGESNDLWLKYIEPVLSHWSFNNFRRMILLADQVRRTGFCDIHSFFNYQLRSLYYLPDWCKEPSIRFVQQKEKQKMAPSTIDMYRSSITRFCSFLCSKGVTSFTQIDHELIKEFNWSDTHSTPAGKNAYNSRIRHFLEYLGDNGLLENKYLYLALPGISAPDEKPVIILTEEEMEELRSILSPSDPTVKLRDKAILNLGLYLGIRASDIVELEFENINWEKETLRFVQKKTQYGLELPIPVIVSNAIYRYITYERPVSSCAKIFIKHKAPYDSLARNACTKALDHALPNREVEGSGFHVTRKTFGTNMLRTGSSAQTIAEGLGHRNTSNIKKYTSKDEKTMRLCPLSMTEYEIEFKGEFQS